MHQETNALHLLWRSAGLDNRVHITIDSVEPSVHMLGSMAVSEDGRSLVSEDPWNESTGDDRGDQVKRGCINISGSAVQDRSEK